MENKTVVDEVYKTSEVIAQEIEKTRSDIAKEIKERSEQNKLAINSTAEFIAQKAEEVAKEVSDKAERLSREVLETADKVHTEEIRKAEEVAREVLETATKVHAEEIRKAEEMAIEVLTQAQKAAFEVLDQASKQAVDTLGTIEGMIADTRVRLVDASKLAESMVEANEKIWLEELRKVQEEDAKELEEIQRTVIENTRHSEMMAHHFGGGYTMQTNCTDHLLKKEFEEKAIELAAKREARVVAIHSVIRRRLKDLKNTYGPNRIAA